MHNLAEAGRETRRIWAREFHYGEAGEIEFVKRVVSHAEKTRYLHQISRGNRHQAEANASSRV